MLYNTVEQLLQMSDGAKPEAIKGQIKKVWERKTGEGKHGPWSMQGVVFTDGNAEIRLVLKNRKEMQKSAEGRNICIVATKGDHGLNGIARKDNEYNKKITPEVHVSGPAEITADGPETPRPAQRQEENGAPRNGGGVRFPENGTKPAPEPEPKLTVAERRQLAMHAYDKRLAQNASAMSRSFDAAFRLVQEVDERHKDAGGFKADANAIKEIAATLFIQSGWDQKAHNVDAFPMRPFQNYEPAPDTTNAAPADAPPVEQSPPEMAQAPFG